MKQKTKKMAAKKVKVTGRRKVLRRAANQNHYNVRATGDETRGKRRDVEVLGKEAKSILKSLPYA